MRYEHISRGFFLDGVDQSSCCKARGVPTECLSYCNRRLLGDGGGQHLNLASCQKYTSPIIACAEEAHSKSGFALFQEKIQQRCCFFSEVVPGTPVNVRVEVADQHAANVTWDAPVKKGETIPMYVVYYKKQGDDHYSTVSELGLFVWGARRACIRFLF